MPAPNRLQYLHQVLCSGQTTTCASTYLEPDRLFLDEDDTSEIEAIVSIHSPAYDRGAGDCDSRPSSTTLTEQFSVLTDLDHGKSYFPEHRRFVLKSASDINAVCGKDGQTFTMVHVRQVEHSRSRLQITRSCFEQLVQSEGIFPAIKDTILHVGNRNTELEVAPPCLRASHLVDVQVPDGDLSGHEVSYGLRYVQRNGRSSSKPWSLRQFSVYNKTRPTKKTATWVLFCLPDVIRTQVDDYLRNAQQDAASNPSEIHALLCSAVIRMWRPYFVDLTEQIETYRRQVEMTDLTDKVSVQKLGGSMLGVLKNIELDILDALLALRATRDTSERIRSLFESMPISRDDGGLAFHEHSQIIIELATSHGWKDLDMLTEQATSLLRKVQGLSVLHANFLGLANGFSLQALAKQQAEEGEEMKKLTRIATLDTKAVKALSIITLVYLPITVVLNFFSTSFVDNGDGDGNGNLRVVGHWWLLFAISVPLTALTLCVWVACVLRTKFSKHESGPRDLKGPSSESAEEDVTEDEIGEKG